MRYMAFYITAEFTAFIPSHKREGSSACFSKTSRMTIGKTGKSFESKKAFLLMMPVQISQNWQSARATERTLQAIVQEIRERDD